MRLYQGDLTVEQRDGQTLTVEQRDGHTLTVKQKDGISVGEADDRIELQRDVDTRCTLTSLT